MRLMASCSQVARACWSSGAILARNALSVGPYGRVSRMAGVTTAGLYFVRFLLSAMEAALPTRTAASPQNGEVTWTSMSSSAFWTPGRFSRPFSLRGQWQGGPPGLRCLHKGGFVAQRSQFRLAKRCASQRGRVRTGMSSRVCLPCPGRLRTWFRRVSCFCTDYRGRTRVCITDFWPRAGMRSCARSRCWRLGVGGNPRRRAHWHCQEQPGVCCWLQCDLADLWWRC